MGILGKYGAGDTIMELQGNVAKLPNITFARPR